MSWFTFNSERNSKDCYKHKLNQLKRLGYKNREKNLALLKLHCGDANKVIKAYQNIQTASTTWTKLNPLPFQRYGTPMVRNNNEIIIAPTSDKYITQSRALYKYNQIRDEFLEWIKYPINFFSIVNTAAIDTDQDIIYVVGYDQLLKIDLESTEMYCIEVTSKYCQLMQYSPAVIAVNKNLHLYARKNDARWNSYNIHMIYTGNKFRIEYRQPTFYADRWYQHELIEIKSKNTILVIGGEAFKSTIEIGSYTFDRDKKEWPLKRTLSGKIPYMYRFGCTITKDDKYMIVFGDGGEHRGQIMLVNIKHKRIKKSHIYQLSLGCPCDPYDKYQAVMVDDYHNNAKVVDGYYRMCSKNISRLPMDLLQLLSLFFCWEYVHLLTYPDVENEYEWDNVFADHWKIQLTELLSSGRIKR